MSLKIPINFSELETKIERALQRGAKRNTEIKDLFLVVRSPDEGDSVIQLPNNMLDGLKRSFLHKHIFDIKIPLAASLRVFFKKDVPVPPGAFLLNLKYGYKYPRVSQVKAGYIQFKEYDPNIKPFSNMPIYDGDEK